MPALEGDIGEERLSEWGEGRGSAILSKSVKTSYDNGWNITAGIQQGEGMVVEAAGRYMNLPTCTPKQLNPCGQLSGFAGTRRSFCLSTIIPRINSYMINWR